MDRSCVVTGGGRGIGLAIAQRLLADGDAVVVLDRDEAALDWTSGHRAGRRVIAVPGDAADETVTARAADLAQAAGRLAGWVNNAAVFRDAWLDAVPAHEVVGLIAANLSLAVTGCATAVRRYLAAGTGGAIVNVSSHQAQRAVRGALPYATAKAAIEGLTRARQDRSSPGGRGRGQLPAVGRCQLHQRRDPAGRRRPVRSGTGPRGGAAIRRYVIV